MPKLIWALPLVVAAMVAVGALYQYAGPPAAARHVYIAAQPLRVVVPVAGAASSYDVYQAHQAEDAGARALVSGGLLQSERLDTAIAQEYAVERGHALETSTALVRNAVVPATVRASDVASALSATHTGNLVTLYARWHTPAGAQALLAAATQTLVSNEGTQALGASGTSAAPGAVFPAAIQADGGASGATLDSTVEAAALQTLLIRMAFAVAAGVVTLLALVAVVRWTSSDRGAADV